MRKVIFTLAMASAMLLASNANAQIKVKLNPKSAATKVAVGAAAGAATSALKSNKGGNSNASEASAPAANTSKPAETKSAVAPVPAPAAASALELSTWNGESFSILYPAKDTKLDSWSGPNELIAENSDMSIVLNARFSDEYKISQINDAIDYFKKKIDDYYDGVKGIKNVDAKTAIVHTTVTNDRDIWMFVIFNKDNAAVLGDFTYPVAKHAEGEALLSQIMSSVKFK